MLGRPSTSQADRRPQSRLARSSIPELPEKSSGTNADADSPVSQDQPIRRTLSFVDLSLQEIEKAILTEDPEWDFQVDFWESVLQGAAAPEFRCMQNRTLGFWIKSFKDWQELRKTQDLNDMATPQQLGQVFFGFAKPRCLELGKLFGGCRSLAQVSFEKTQVSLPEIFTAGVLMSEIISSTTKLSFVLGLVDLEDKKSLNQKQFSTFVGNFIRGLCSAFGLNSCASRPGGGFRQDDDRPEASRASRGHWSSLLVSRRHTSAWVNSDDEHRPRFAKVPTEEAINIIAGRLYSRISARAARRIVKLHSSLKTEAERAAVLAAIKARQSSATAHAQRNGGAGAKIPGNVEQRLPFAVLLDWCFRVVQDPLAIPYALAVERFCPRESSADDNPENFEADDAKTFRLSHTMPASMSVEDDHETEAAQHVPTRADVIACRYVYTFASQRSFFLLTPEELDAEMSRAGHTDVEFAVKLQAACVQAEDIRSKTRKPSFMRFLKLLCPWAMPKHLRMFDRWCQQYDDLQNKKAQLRSDKNALADFQWCMKVYSNQPVIPQAEMENIIKDFERLDLQHRGYIEVAELERTIRARQDEGVTLSMVRSFDVSGDGVIDQAEFIQMMCPVGYRLDGVADEVSQTLAEFLQAYVEEEQRHVTIEEDRFEHGAHRLRANSVSLHAALPIAPQDEWEKWNSFFDRVDQDEDGFISAEELRACSKALNSGSACELLLAVLDPQMRAQISRELYLETLLKVNRWRSPLRRD